MKKKFNILCGIMLVALLLVELVPTLVTLSTGYYSAFKVENIKAAVVKGPVTAVSLLPKDAPMKFTHEITNEKNGKTENVQIAQALINSPYGKNEFTWHMVVMPILSLMTMGIMVGILVIFVMIVLAVNRLHVFDRRMEKRLAWLGVLMIAQYAVLWCICWVIYEQSVARFEFADYTLTLPNLPNGTILLSGLGMLLIAQIFKIARSLKEEQELTI